MSRDLSIALALALFASLQLAVMGAMAYEHNHPPKPLHERASK